MYLEHFRDGCQCVRYLVEMPAWSASPLVVTRGCLASSSRRRASMGSTGLELGIVLTIARHWFLATVQIARFRAAALCTRPAQRLTSR